MVWRPAWLLVFLPAILIAIFLLASCEEADFTPTLPPTPDEAREATLTTAATVVIEPPLPEAVLARIQLSPDIASVAAGQRAIFTAIALDASEKPIPQAKITWSTRLEAGRISPSGLFTAARVPGLYRDAITATATYKDASVTDTASVEVTDPAVASHRTLHTIAIYPPSIILLPGQVAGLSALGWDEQGHFVQNLQLLWSVASPEIGKVDRIGFFTAGSQPGVYPNGVSVTAIQDSAQGRIERQGFISVTIREQGLEARVLSQVSIVPNNVTLAPGQRASFIARAFDQTGRALGQITYDWAVESSRAGRLERPGQFIAGDQTGRFENALSVTATHVTPAGVVRVKATATITVQLPAARGVLTTARITPGSVIAIPGQRFVFSAAGLDSRGRSVPVRARWSVEDPKVGSITATGVFTSSLQPGIYRDAIRLELAQEQDGRTITLTQHATVSITGRLARLEIQPARITVASGQSIPLRAVGYDEQGLEMPSLRLRWTVASPSVGRISPAGVFTPSALPGTYVDAVKVVASAPAGR